MKLVRRLVWTLVALAVAALVLTLQPYVLVVARNLSGASLTLSFHTRGNDVGPRRLARGGWMLGVLKSDDTDLDVLCEVDGASPILKHGPYMTSYLQQLVVVDVRRCDQVEDREYTIGGLVSGLLPEIR